MAVRGVTGREEIRRPGNRRHLFEVSDQRVRVVADTCDVAGMAGLVAEQLAQLANGATQLLFGAVATGPDLVAQGAVVHRLAMPRGQDDQHFDLVIREADGLVGF